MCATASTATMASPSQSVERTARFLVTKFLRLELPDGIAPHALRMASIIIDNRRKYGDVLSVYSDDSAGIEVTYLIATLTNLPMINGWENIVAPHKLVIEFVGWSSSGDNICLDLSIRKNGSIVQEKQIVLNPAQKDVENWLLQQADFRTFLADVRQQILNSISAIVAGATTAIEKMENRD